ncbi:unnamed protein product [Paramecium sonneborni]|uniref:UBC core domain-containing protein n=1 Tax=Paramecium sonneborni TaxID=65129 RepID=A0A8S1QUC9_9CILI|nr:unnamed protein product [Paramecium sonneborni]
MQNQKIKILSNTAAQPQQNKIKILPDIKVDQDRQPFFSSLLDETLMTILTNGNKYNLFAYMDKDVVIEQFWNFEFEGQNVFKGKKISGVLKFQPDHPARPPKFYFNPVQSNGQVDQVIQHENIYGDHSLCIPMLNDQVWNQSNIPYDILQAIEHIFANPNWVEGSDAPANPIFSSKSEQEKKQIQLKQAKFLPDFKLNSE